jgi:hypothetical protein
MMMGLDSLGIKVVRLCSDFGQMIGWGDSTSHIFANATLPGQLNIMHSDDAPHTPYHQYWTSFQGDEDECI